MAPVSAFGRNLIVLTAFAVMSISVTACVKSEPQVSVPAPATAEPTDTTRSEIVSAGASPDVVARTFVLAMRDDRPQAANALWAGPAMFESGYDSWRGAHGLELDPSQDASRFPVPRSLPAQSRAASERLLDDYLQFATVSGRLRLDRGDSSFEPGGLAFVVRLGRNGTGEWDVLGMSFNQ